MNNYNMANKKLSVKNILFILRQKIKSLYSVSRLNKSKVVS